MIFRPRRVSMSAASCALALIVASCTLLGKAELVQCAADDECPTKRCDLATNLCVAGDAGLPDADTSTPPVDAPTDTGSGLSCKAHGDCLVREACVTGKCVAIGDATEPCTDVPSDVSRDTYRDPKAIVVGVYVYGSAGGPEVVAADAALNQINKALELRNDRVRIGAIYCKKANDLTKSSAKSTAAKLAAMGVNAVVGQFELSELASSGFREEVAKSGLAVMSTLGNASAVQDPTPNDDVKYRFLVDELQSQIDAVGGTNPYDAAVTEADTRVGKLFSNAGKIKPAPVKVAFLVSADSSNVPTLEAGALYTKLKDSAVLTGGGFDLQEPTLVPSLFDTPGTPNAAAQALQLMAPQIIIGIGGDEVGEVLTRVEGGWNKVANPLPVWILSSRAKFTYESLRVAAAGNISFGSRFIGVDFDGDATKSAALRSGSLRAGIQAFDTLYDGIFAFTLAGLRADQARGTATGPLTGAQLRQGFDEVLQKAGATNTDPVELPGSFDAAVSIVRANRFVHMRGVTGAFEFSVAPPKRGARRMTAAANPYYCFKPSTQETTHYVDSNGLQTLCAHP